MTQWTLKLDSSVASDQIRNFRLPSWPPPDDFPISFRPDGTVLSKVCDSTWDLRPYYGTHCTVYFGDGPTPKRYVVDAGNGRLFRLCMLWFMYGKRYRIKPGTLKGYAEGLKVLFSVCSQKNVGVLASDIGRFDRVVEDALAPAVLPVYKDKLINALHELWEARQALGFALLTPHQIATLSMLVPDQAVKQHLVLPPRLWLYQTERLRTFLEDFRAHDQALADLFRASLQAYVHNFGNAKAFLRQVCGYRSPFNGKSVPGCVQLGRFPEVAARYGVADLLKRWVLPPGTDWESDNPLHTVTKLAAYFNQVTWVGVHHLINWSGMRTCEALLLKTDCLLIEEDPRFGRLYTLRGASTKTIEDDDARWVTADEAQLAVTAMSLVSKLRIEAASQDPAVQVTSNDRTNPYLVTRGCEPWTPARRHGQKLPLSYRPYLARFDNWRVSCPNLFDEDMLRIEPEDFRVARFLEPTFDARGLLIGDVWPLGRHQLRRTFIVGMASADVSTVSQQLQAKHLTQQQVLYYNRGYSAMNYSQDLAGELIVERYRGAARIGQDLNAAHWVSPHGPEHKQRIIDRFHHLDSADRVMRDIKQGKAAVRLTLFGVCTRRDTCPYGGWQNFVHCADCTDALFDTRKYPKLREIGRTIAAKLEDAPMKTPLRDVLERKAKAVTEVLNVTS